MPTAAVPCSALTKPDIAEMAGSRIDTRLHHDRSLTCTRVTASCSYSCCSKLLLSAVHSPLGHVHLGLLADQVGEPAADTADGGHGVHDLLLAIDVGVEHTQNVLELLARNERLQARRQLMVSRLLFCGRTASGRRCAFFNTSSQAAASCPAAAAPASKIGESHSNLHQHSYDSAP